MERKLTSNCRIFQQSLAGFIEGEIDPTLQVSLEEHMKTCGFCRYLYHGISRVSHHLKKLRNVKTSPAFQTNLYHRIHQEIIYSEKPLHKLKEWTLSRRRVLIISPAIAVILLTAVIIWAPNMGVMITPSPKPGQMTSQPIEQNYITPAVEITYYIMEKQPPKYQDNSEFAHLARSFPDIVFVSDQNGSSLHHITF